MKIAAVDAFTLRTPAPDGQPYWGLRAWGPADAPAAQYPPRWRMRAAYTAAITTVVVRITTDTGLVGYGEAKAPVAPEATRAVVRDLLAPLIMGADPLDVDVLWERMYGSMRLRAHTSGFLLEAISGVDLALWDVRGKALGVPVCKLLGGTYRDRVRVYASGLPGLVDPRDAAARTRLEHEARALVARGFRALKLAGGFGVDADVESVRTVRAAVGEGIEIFCDAGGNYDVAHAHRLGRALEALGVGWLEAPLPAEHVDGYAQLARALALPIANDVVSTRYQVCAFLVRSALDVVQPDVCRAGGLSECRRIAQLADVFGAGIAPHVSIGSPIQFAASAHLAAATPNFLVMEFWTGAAAFARLAPGAPLQITDGVLPVPMGPGLGLTIDDAALRHYAASDATSNPQ